LSFKKDIFISYAHIDDEALIEGEPGWISEFHRSLEVRLSQLLGYRPVIWRDKALDGNHNFSSEILTQLPEIAILVSIHSPRYVKSDWCIREVNEFYKIAESNIGAMIGTKSRIFKVIKTPVELSQHPPVVQGLLGYEFFKLDQETGKPREFSKLFGKDAQLAYWAKLDDLAHDLASLLAEIGKYNLNNSNEKNLGETTIFFNNQNNSSFVNSDSKRLIYLAESSSEMKEKRELISRTLSDNGFKVLPDRNLPLEFDEYYAEVKNLISSCELSIHLIGCKFGIVPEGTEKSKIQIQNEIAAEYSLNNNLKRLIWMPPDIEIEDERQINYVDNLKRDEHSLIGADFIIGTIEDLEFSITDKLNENKSNKTEESSQENIDGPKKIYLVCDQLDLDSIADVENFLFDKGFEVIIPAFDGDQTELRLDHQENLKICDAVIIYYGNGSDLWLRSKTRDLLKVVGYGRDKPLIMKGIIIAPPINAQKERFKSHELKVINVSMNNFLYLEEFCKGIK
jgi:hypothetical protein